MEVADKVLGMISVRALRMSVGSLRRQLALKNAEIEALKATIATHERTIETLNATNALNRKTIEKLLPMEWMQ